MGAICQNSFDNGSVGIKKKEFCADLYISNKVTENKLPVHKTLYTVYVSLILLQNSVFAKVIPKYSEQFMIVIH